MAHLSKIAINIVILLLTLLMLYSCSILQESNRIKSDDSYVNCHLQNVQMVQTGDKKLDRERQKKVIKYNENRRIFLLFFSELSKESEYDNTLLQYFEPDAQIEYGNISVKKSSTFIDYMDYLTEHTNKEQLTLGRKKCAGKKYHKLELKAPNQKKLIVWYFTFSENHKIKYFKEVLESY